MTDGDRHPIARGLAPLRKLLWIAAGVAAVLGMAVIYDQGRQTAAPPRADAPAFGGPFSLTAPDGTTVTDRSLAGRPYAIFFGFTRCPDVCPTSLARMARLRRQLGADGMKFAIVFVSVDPGHDRPADLGRYVAMFGTPIIGLTGTEAQLAQIKKGYGVYSAKVPQPGGDYTIDHTAAIYLMGADGRLFGTIDPQEADAVALAKLQRMIR